MKKIIIYCILSLIFIGTIKGQEFDNQEVTFGAEHAGQTYGGTLSLPKSGKPRASIIIVSGTGKQDRDGLMAGHKIFLEIADALAEKGYAVLRTDDRGVGKTNGVYETATTEDFALDALQALRYLKGRKETKNSKIGLLGHSEGGMAIAIAASKSEDVAFLISLSGLAMDGYDALIQQNNDLVAASKMDETDKKRSNEINAIMFSAARRYADSTDMEQKLNETYTVWKQKDDAFFKTLNKEFDHFRFPIYSYAKFASGPWYRFFVKYKAKPVLSKIKVPILAINGERDVMVSYRENLENWRSFPAQGGNRKVTTKSLPGLNHLLLPCQSCDAAEMANIKAGISTDVLLFIRDWLKNIKI